ncbi:hypothetical protein D3C78_1512480 [compost metagenome]
MRVGQRLIIDPNLVATQFQRIALEAVERRGLAQCAVLRAKRSFMPRADQASVTQRTISQRRAGMWAFALKGT